MNLNTLCNKKLYIINTRCVQRTRESHKECTDLVTFYNNYPYQDAHRTTTELSVI